MMYNPLKARRAVRPSGASSPSSGQGARTAPRGDPHSGGRQERDVRFAALRVHDDQMAREGRSNSLENETDLVPMDHELHVGHTADRVGARETRSEEGET